MIGCPAAFLARDRVAVTAGEMNGGVPPEKAFHSRFALFDQHLIETILQVAMPLVAIDHVQLAMPPGGEAAARDFYGGLLGLPEVPKPSHLAVRGGCWFERGALRVHLGVEAGFRAARKAHPAFRVTDAEALIAALTAGGHPVRREPQPDGPDQIYVDDPFGNRIELIEG